MCLLCCLSVFLFPCQVSVKPLREEPDDTEGFKVSGPSGEPCTASLYFTAISLHGHPARILPLLPTCGFNACVRRTSAGRYVLPSSCSLTHFTPPPLLLVFDLIVQAILHVWALSIRRIARTTRVPTLGEHCEVTCVEVDGKISTEHSGPVDVDDLLSV